MVQLCSLLVVYWWLLFCSNGFVSAFVVSGNSKVLHYGVRCKIGNLVARKLSSLSLPQNINQLLGIHSETSTLFEGVHRHPSAPSACQFIIANPAKFLKQPALLSQFNVKIGDQSEEATVDYLVRALPVLYIADKHMEYGTLGYVLNKKCVDITMNDIYPNFRHLRHRPVYEGGPPNSGSSFTMVHRKVGFPENRLHYLRRTNAAKFPPTYVPCKSILHATGHGREYLASRTSACSSAQMWLWPMSCAPRETPTPGTSSERSLYLIARFFTFAFQHRNRISVDISIDSAYCRFFQWATVWAPGQLEAECQRGCWITVDGPVEVRATETFPPVRMRLLTW